HGRQRRDRGRGAARWAGDGLFGAALDGLGQGFVGTGQARVAGGGQADGGQVGGAGVDAGDAGERERRVGFVALALEVVGQPLSGEDIDVVAVGVGSGGVVAAG